MSANLVKARTPSSRAYREKIDFITLLKKELHEAKEAGEAWRFQANKFAVRLEIVETELTDLRALKAAWEDHSFAMKREADEREHIIDRLKVALLQIKSGEVAGRPAHTVSGLSEHYYVALQRCAAKALDDLEAAEH